MNDKVFVEGFGAITQYPTLSDFPLGPRQELPKPELGLLERTLRRGLSDVTRMFMHAAQSALVDADAQPQDVHMVFGSAFGELSTAEALMNQAFTDDSSSPARFRNSVHNTAPGLLSISSTNVLAATAIAAGWNTVAMGLLEARALLASGERRVLLVFAEEGVPHALSDDFSYGPAAVALVLSQTLSDRPPRATLSHLTRAASGLGALRNPFAGENHPLGPAVLLAQALEAGRSEVLQVGSGPTPWCVELAVLGANTRRAAREADAEVEP